MFTGRSEELSNLFAIKGTCSTPLQLENSEGLQKTVQIIGSG